MRIGKNNTEKNQKFMLTKSEQEFIKDLSRKIVVRAYLINSVERHKPVIAKVKDFFFKTRKYEAPVISILQAIENSE